MIDQREDATADVVVVGGGPAGCAAVRAAIDETPGLHVVLLERGQRFRDKACGDLFMPAAVRQLRHFGLDDVTLRSLGGIPFDSINLLGSTQRLWCVKYPHERPWMLSRKAIDQATRDHLPSGADVRYGVTARRIELSPNNTLQVIARGASAEPISITCAVVILAGGVECALSRQWGISGHPTIAPSITMYVPGVDSENPAFRFADDCRPGYRWTFPLGSDYANVGVCSLSRTNGSALRDLGQCLIPRTSAAPLRWRGGAGALWSGRGRLWHRAPGILSCGDAAGLVDPITGEGITIALESGESAGRCAGRFIARRDNRCFEQHSYWIRDQVGSSYGTAHIRTLWKHLCGAHGS